MSIKTSIIVGWMSFRLYLDEGPFRAIRMGVLAAWNTWRGDYDLIAIEDDKKD